jgi:hypothetical protein
MSVSRDDVLLGRDKVIEARVMTALKSIYAKYRRKA